MITTTFSASRSAYAVLSMIESAERSKDPKYTSTFWRCRLCFLQLRRVGCRRRRCARSTVPPMKLAIRSTRRCPLVGQCPRVEVGAVFLLALLSAQLVQHVVAVYDEDRQRALLLPRSLEEQHSRSHTHVERPNAARQRDGHGQVAGGGDPLAKALTLRPHHEQRPPPVVGGVVEAGARRLGSVHPETRDFGLGDEVAEVAHLHHSRVLGGSGRSLDHGGRHGSRAVPGDHHSRAHLLGRADDAAQVVRVLDPVEGDQQIVPMRARSPPGRRGMGRSRPRCPGDRATPPGQ